MKLNTYEWGDESAALVVCLHGVTGHGLRFRKLAEERLANRFHVVAADLRGHGHSTWDEPWDIATHVADLLETFDRPAYWIGHSFGGRLTMEVAAVRPELVRRAVLLDPADLHPAPALDRSQPRSSPGGDVRHRGRGDRSADAPERARPHAPGDFGGGVEPACVHRRGRAAAPALLLRLRRRRLHADGHAATAVRRVAHSHPRRRRIPLGRHDGRARPSFTGGRSATCSRSRSCPAGTASSGTRSTRPQPRSTPSSRLRELSRRGRSPRARRRAGR